MNGSRLKDLIYEKYNGNDLVYVLSRADLISLTEYKVMEGLDDEIFVKMMKILINGRPALYYLTDEYRPVLSIVPNLSKAGLIAVIRSIIENASKLKNNGFLTCKNVEASIEHIYVTKNTYKAAFIYLPVRETIYEDEAEFERKLRISIAKIAKSTDKKETDCIKELIKELEDVNIPLAVVLKGQKKLADNKKSIWIECLDEGQKIVIEISKDEFIIGKWADMVDGVISFNRMISRIHCKINIRDGKYSITDLRSANGTFVNGVRLIANKPFLIKKDDIIRIADSRFRIIEE